MTTNVHTTLSATQINRLAQRLAEAPLGRSVTTAIAAERFGRLLAAKIGAERGALAAASILAGETFDQAEARLTLVLDYGNNDPEAGAETNAGAEPKAEEPAADTIGIDPRPATSEASDPADTALTKEPKANPTPVIGKQQAIHDQAQSSELCKNAAHMGHCAFSGRRYG